MKPTAMLLTLFGSAVLASCGTGPLITSYEWGPFPYGGSRGDPIDSQAPTSESGGVSMAQAASENGESTFTLEPPPQRQALNSSTPCIYHRSAQRYELCLRIANDGRCVSYGAACTDRDRPRSSVWAIP